MKQGTFIKAKQAFTMKTEGARGKPVSVKIADIFMVTSAMNTEYAKIDRTHKAKIGIGYQLSIESINQLFDLVECK